MDATTILGTAAGVLTTVSLVPQAVRILRLRAADEVSAATFAVMGAGIALWAVYGVLIRSGPVIVFNAASLLLCAVILALKFHFRRR